MDTYYGIRDDEGYWYGVWENWTQETMPGPVKKLKKTCERRVNNAPMLFERYETARRWAKTVGAHVVKMGVFGKRHSVWVHLGPSNNAVRVK